MKTSVFLFVGQAQREGNCGESAEALEVESKEIKMRIDIGAEETKVHPDLPFKERK